LSRSKKIWYAIDSKDLDVVGNNNIGNDTSDGNLPAVKIRGLNLKHLARCVYWACHWRISAAGEC
jgi:hypothetical protein